MSKVLSLRLADDIYERLEISSEKMGITKSGYINVALKSMFNQEDVLVQMPDLLNRIPVLMKGVEDLKIAVDKINDK